MQRKVEDLSAATRRTQKEVRVCGLILKLGRTFELSGLRAFFAAFLLVLGCSDSSTRGQAWQFTDDAGEDAGNGMCLSDDDCPTDHYCERSVACGQPFYCVAGYSPCSAAAPFLVCGCDGVIDYESPGCPGPFAWQVGALAWDVTGGPCDASASSPFEFRIEAVLGEDPAPGEPMWARLRGFDDVEPARVGANRTVRFQATGDPWVSFSVVLLVDRDGDGECSSGDSDFATSIERQQVDFLTFAVNLELNVVHGLESCVAWAR